MKQKKSKQTLGCLISIPVIAFIICLPAYLNVYSVEIRTFISYIFGLLAFLSIIFIVISLINPNKSMFWLKGKGKATRKTAFFSYFILFLFAELMMFFVTPSKIHNTDTENGVEKASKLSTSYYDSIYSVAYNSIDLNNEPRIEFNSLLKKVTVTIRLIEKIDEEKVRSIGIYYHDKYLVEPYNRVYVFLYTPEMENENAGCYAIAHSDPDLDAKIVNSYSH